MRVRNKDIRRAHVTVADRSKKKFKSRGVTVYGVTPAQLIERLEAMNREFFADRSPEHVQCAQEPASSAM